MSRSLALTATLGVLFATAIASAAGVLPKPEWTVKVPSTPATTPVSAVIGSLYYVSDANGMLWAVNTSSRQLQWSLRWDAIDSIVAFPEHDVLVVFVDQSGAWGIRGSTGAMLWANDTISTASGPFISTYKFLIGTVTYSMDAGQSSLTVFNCYDATTGATYWSLNATEIQNPFLVDGLVGYTNVSSSSVITLINPNSAHPTPLWTQAVESFVGAGNGLILALNATVSNNSFSFTRDLLFIGASTGEILGRITNFTSAYSQNAYFTPDGKTAIVVMSYADAFNHIHAVDLTTFRVLWTVAISAIPSFANGGIQSVQFLMPGTFTVRSPGVNYNLFNLTTMDLATGAVLSAVASPPTTPAQAVAVFGSTLYVPNLIGYAAFDPKTGALTYLTYNQAFPIVLGTQQPLGLTSTVAQLADGSVAAFSN